MLTGDIQINHHTIGHWKAKNVGGNQVQDQDQTYKVEVEYTNKEGYHLIAEFYVVHPYDRHAGALTLAAKILAEAPDHLRRPLLSEEGYTLDHMSRMLR